MATLGLDRECCQRVSLSGDRPRWGPRKNARLPEECRIDAMLGGLLVLPSLPYAKPFELPLEFGGVPLQPIDCISSQMNGK